MAKKSPVVQAAQDAAIAQGSAAQLIDSAANIALSKLTLAIPSALVPIAEAYGPALIALGKDRLAAWIEAANSGDPLFAWTQLVPYMDNDDLVNALNDIHTDLAALNAANSIRIAREREAIVQLLKILIPIAQAAMAV